MRLKMIFRVGAAPRAVAEDGGEMTWGVGVAGGKGGGAWERPTRVDPSKQDRASPAAPFFDNLGVFIYGTE